MGISIRAFFNALTTWFMVFNGLAKSAHNLTTWCEETTETFVDEARAQRQARLKLINIEMAKEAPDLNAIAQITTTKE